MPASVAGILCITLIILHHALLVNYKCFGFHSQSVGKINPLRQFVCVQFCLDCFFNKTARSKRNQASLTFDIYRFTFLVFIRITSKFYLLKTKGFSVWNLSSFKLIVANAGYFKINDPMNFMEFIEFGVFASVSVNIALQIQCKLWKLQYLLSISPYLLQIQIFLPFLV